jgi:hypothetical protein
MIPAHAGKKWLKGRACKEHMAPMRMPKKKKQPHKVTFHAKIATRKALAVRFRTQAAPSVYLTGDLRCVWLMTDGTGQDTTIPQIRLFGLESRVETKLSRCYPQLSFKIGEMREDIRGRLCSSCPATKRTLNNRLS